MKKLLTITLLALSASSLAFTDRANVLNVEEVLKFETYQTPYETCWSEDVPVYAKYAKHAKHSYTNEILGGILGGVIGNQMGRGRGNKAMTVAGVLLGASIASDHSKKRKSAKVVRYKQVRQCETKYRQEHKQVIDFYRVTARYNDREFSFRSETLPGASVKVAISPVNY
ncbi:glycine zipper 2TM domain-containing protein [Candidatus Thioglobus sp.]|uniref:glycine zipper 2TM domain-containing protein n=1 Tax=Candidatus Thioglobus sp. TaxID=2026721 RepID=UPI003D1012C4